MAQRKIPYLKVVEPPENPKQLKKAERKVRWKKWEGAVSIFALGLTVSYKGYRVQNIYQEGDYFAVTPEDGNKLVVMKFEIKNKGKKKVRLDTEKLGITFYACFDGKNRIKETASLGTRSLSSYGETIRGGKKKTAVLLFQIPKDQADKISGETLYAEIKDTIYSLKYK